MIRRNLELQTRLISEIMDFTIVGQQKARLRLEPIDAHEAVRSVLEICDGEIAAAQITVHLSPDAAKSVVRADSARLQQVMWNLVKNAVKFSPPGGAIFITSANDAAGGLTLEFADHGIGIEPGFLPLVFEAFQQGDPSPPHGGLGLGMFIAKGLTEALEGTLTVASGGRDQGTQFRLNFKTTLVPME